MSAHSSTSLLAVHPAVAIALIRQTTLVAQLAGFIVTGMSIGMAPCSAEIARWTVQMLLSRGDYQ
jgi:hypothetical protein